MRNSSRAQAGALRTHEPVLIAGRPKLLAAISRLQKWKPSSAVSVRGVTKWVPLNVERKL